jgi:hypothetical protein
MFYIIVILAAVFATPVKADEILKFRYTVHRISLQVQEIGDVDAHTMGLYRNSGLALFPDQSVGTISWTGTTDYVKGVGPFSHYVNLALSDGSVLWYKVTGSATRDGTKTLFAGSVNILGGKGRFEGAKGDGTATATPVNADDQYGDAVINVKK